MKNIVGILFAALIITGFNVQSAMAVAKFKKAFSDKYAVKHKSKEYATVVRKATCNVCHVKGAKSKTYRNDYGKLLAKLIEGNADKRIKEAKKKSSEEGKKVEAKVLEELEKAFAKAEKEKSDGGKGPTYGELIASGKLPVDIDKAVAKYKIEKAKEEAEEKKKEQSEAVAGE